MKVVIIMGSESDRDFAEKITTELEKYSIRYTVNIASAHKQPLEVLNIIKSNAAEKGVVYITIAGRSNALSGFVAANSSFPVIACPPFKDKTDMLVNIHSTLQMPSNTPVLTILDPGNCALAIKRILELK
ncbi:MAG: AIR carboxylase family protein [Candidatus Neomarinimicrobiota bacterium]